MARPTMKIFTEFPGDAEGLAETFAAGVAAAQLGKCRGDDPMIHSLPWEMAMLERMKSPNHLEKAWKVYGWDADF